MDHKKVQDLINEALDLNKSLFVVDWSIGVGNKILVSVDGDEGANISECIRISRHIEHNLLEEGVERDFSLEVSSPGVENPIKFLRQYNKNIGRTLSVILNNDEKIEGTLKLVDEEKITLEWEAKEKKAIGKGNQKVTKQREVLYTEIKIAKTIIKI
jgi:ribosome maturation factor RimP